MIIKSYNLFKTLLPTHKNPLTLEIQTNEHKKEILSWVNSTRLIKLNIVTVNYGSSRAVMRFRKKSKIQDFVVYVLIVSNNHFKGGNNISMFIRIEIIYQMHIVCQYFNNLIYHFL
jgi:hypothetical protein